MHHGTGWRCGLGATAAGPSPSLLPREEWGAARPTRPDWRMSGGRLRVWSCTAPAPPALCLWQRSDALRAQDLGPQHLRGDAGAQGRRCSGAAPARPAPQGAWSSIAPCTPPWTETPRGLGSALPAACVGTRPGLSPSRGLCTVQVIPGEAARGQVLATLPGREATTPSWGET